MSKYLIFHIFVVFCIISCTELFLQVGCLIAKCKCRVVAKPTTIQLILAIQPDNQLAKLYSFECMESNFTHMLSMPNNDGKQGIFVNLTLYIVKTVLG